MGRSPLLRGAGGKTSLTVGKPSAGGVHTAAFWDPGLGSTNGPSPPGPITVARGTSILSTLKRHTGWLRPCPGGRSNFQAPVTVARKSAGLLTGPATLELS